MKKDKMGRGYGMHGVDEKSTYTGNKGKVPLERPTHTRYKRMRMNLKEIGC
jgi:hypothetical protein